VDSGDEVQTMIAPSSQSIIPFSFGPDIANDGREDGAPDKCKCAGTCISYAFSIFYSMDVPPVSSASAF
jgi:hypothetical protein